MASHITGRVCGSYGGIGSSPQKNNERTCSSQPFTKPKMKLARITESLKRKVLTFLGSHNDNQKEDYSLDESKRIIRDLSAELTRVLQIRDVSFLTRVSENACSVKAGQDFILLWAEKVKHSEQRQLADHQTLDEEQRLKDAREVMSDWAWKLKKMDQESLCLGEDVCSVLQDLEKQWKRGHLPNMLPVMDFIIWSILQEHDHEDSVENLWLSNIHQFKSKVTPKRIPESVWNWIWKASEDITLDPLTANPSLKLSSDRKRVKMDTIIESQHNPWDGYTRSRLKYDGWWCVQGTQGFTSGKHYWEVEVQGKNEWRIGVVKESAPRQGFTELSTRTGYWTLRLQLGQLMAMTSPVTKLDRSAPSRLGVFLDLEEGQVSFYDARQKCHIYCFDVDLNDAEKIYPVFGTIETGRELVIL